MSKKEKINSVMQIIYNTAKIKRDVENGKEHIWIDNIKEVSEKVIDFMESEIDCSEI